MAIKRKASRWTPGSESPTDLVSTLATVQNSYEELKSWIMKFAEDPLMDEPFSTVFDTLAQRSYWLMRNGLALSRTCEYNASQIQTSALKVIDPKVIAILDKTAKTADVAIRHLLAMFVVTEEQAEPESVVSTFNSHATTIIDFTAKTIEVHAAGLAGGLALLNLWLDIGIHIEETGAVRVIGSSMAALDKCLHTLQHVWDGAGAGLVQRDAGNLLSLVEAGRRVLAEVAASHPSAATMATAMTATDIPQPVWRTSIFYEAYGKSPEIVRDILRQGVNPNCRGPEGFTLLHVAAELNDLELARLLIELCANPMVVAKKQLPILIAALSGHVDMVKLLLENGVDVNCMSPYQVPTIVYAACESRNLEFVRYLILEKKADISIANTDGDTPLGRAVSMGHPQIVRFLLEHRAPHVPNNQGVYPIHLAAAFNRTAELEILLSFEIDVNIHHPASRRTPIWWAAYSGSIHALDILVQHGGDVNMADAWGQTPVFIAAINNLPDVLQKLLGLGADPSIATEDGVTPLGVASEKGFAGTVDILTEYEKGSTARTLAES